MEIEQVAELARAVAALPQGHIRRGPPFRIPGSPAAQGSSPG